VGLAEAQRWTDYTFLQMQYIQESSKNEVSFSNINHQFPYNINLDFSMMDMMEVEENSLLQDDCWSAGGDTSQKRTIHSPFLARV